MAMPEPIRIALADKEAKDNARMLELAARLDGKEASSGADAMRLAMATPTSVDRSVPLPMSVATAPVSLEPTTTASVSSGVVSQPATLAADVLVRAAAPSRRLLQLPPSRRLRRRGRRRRSRWRRRPPPRPRPRHARVDGFLPVPELTDDGSETAAAPPPSPAPAAKPAPTESAPADAATLEERMLAGSTPADPRVANSYASASQEDEGLTGMVLKLIRKQQDDGLPAQ